MKKKWIIGLIALLGCAAAMLGLLNRNSSPAGEGLLLQAGGKTYTVSYEKADQISFEGDLVNGKGEVTHHAYQGIELSSLLSANGIAVSDTSKITAVSEDNYSAELTGTEVLEPGKVYIAVTADGDQIEGIEGGQGAQLIVFGDSNSRRAVRYLKTIAVE
ncbi:MAG: hypothetical protein E7190_13420 [Erysipelotrichaceae bacterium]|nr:hypothetical protein [Erysipelotrichaceae bacterium]